MRFRHKKLFISGIAVTVAGVLGVGSLIQTSISVQASAEMMPGIEQIIKDASSNNKSFRILEIVDDKSEAEIGYYISGQEPYVKLYQYTETTDEGEDTISFSSLEDGLSKIKDPKTRKEFAENKKYAANGVTEAVDENGNKVSTGIKDILYALQGEGEHPLSFSEYQERYFFNPGNWKELKFANADGSTRTEKVEVQGQYQKNPSGTGDYTKKEQNYYPIRENTGDRTNEMDKFRENIQNFFYSEGDGAKAPYYIEFEEEI